MNDKVLDDSPRDLQHLGPVTGSRSTSWHDDDASREIDRPSARCIQLNPGHFDRIFHAQDAHIWGSIAGWGGVCLIGCLNVRRLGIHPQVRWAWRRRFATTCVSLGSITFFEWGFPKWQQEIEHDENLRIIFIASQKVEIASWDPRIRGALDALSNLPATKLEMSSLVNMDGPSIPENAHAISRFYRNIAWHSHRIWSSDMAKALSGFTFRDQLQARGVSSDDIDICVTHFANCLQMSYWDEWSGISMCAFLGLYALNCNPLLRRVTFLSTMATLYFRVYQHLAYPRQIHNKRAVAEFLQKEYNI